MPWETQYDAGKQTLVVTATGHVSDEDAKALTARAISVLKETRATRVLGDCRKMESAPSVATVYWLVRDYGKHGVSKQTRIAVVHSKARPATELAQFYETVCLNQQYEARVFLSPAAAEAWLQSGTTT